MATDIQNGSSARPSMLLEISPKLLMIFSDIAYRACAKDYNVMITSIIRPRTTDSGVHAVGRAIDFLLVGDNNNVVPYNSFYDELLDSVNKQWQYDPARPEMVTLMWHSVGGDFGGFHFHLQVLSFK